MSNGSEHLPEYEAPHLVRLSVNLNQETAAALLEMAARRGISYTEAVRRAISVYKYLSDEVSEGRAIQTADGRGKHVKELMLL